MSITAVLLARFYLVWDGRSAGQVARLVMPFYSTQRPLTDEEVFGSSPLPLDATVVHGIYVRRAGNPTDIQIAVLFGGLLPLLLIGAAIYLLLGIPGNSQRGHRGWPRNQYLKESTSENEEIRSRHADAVRRTNSLDSVVFFTLRLMRGIFGILGGEQIVSLIISWYSNPSSTRLEWLAYTAVKLMLIAALFAAFAFLRFVINRIHLKRHSTVHPSLEKEWGL